MEFRPKALFSKFSDIVCVLPYIGKYSKWKYLMMSLSKTSNKLWYKDHPALIKAYMLTKWRDESDEFASLCHAQLGSQVETIQGVDEKGQPTSTTKTMLKNLMFVVDCSLPQHVEFIKKAKEMCLHSLNKLVVDNLNALSNSSMRELSILLMHVIPKGTKDILVRFNEQVAIDALKNGLQESLPKITNLIFFDQIKFTDNTLKTLIEGARNAKTLSIYNCILDLSKDFSVDDCLDYKTEILNLSLTIDNCRENQVYREVPSSKPQQPNSHVVEYLVRALSKTKMRESLKTVYIWEMKDSIEDTQKLFDSHGFKVEVNDEEINVA